MPLAALGLAFMALGLMGLFLKTERYNVKRLSYTGHPLRWGPILLLIVGFVLLVRDLLLLWLSWTTFWVLMAISYYLEFLTHKSYCYEKNSDPG